jgi:hypothetical protein
MRLAGLVRMIEHTGAPEQIPAQGRQGQANQQRTRG